jgi:hypothetical protein
MKYQGHHHLPQEQIGYGRNRLASLSCILPCLPWDDQSSCLADAPEVKEHEDQEGGRKEGCVDGVEIGQGAVTDFRPALNQPLNPQPYSGHVFQHAGANGDRPKCELVPGQQIPREVGEENDQKRSCADDPVELAWRVKRAREENTQQVQKRHKDQGVCAPMMDVPDQSAEPDLVLKSKDGLVGLVRERKVNEFQEHTRPEKQEDQHNRHAPQPPGEGPSKGFFRNVSRPKMQNQAVEQTAIAVPSPSCPQCTWKNGVTDALKEVCRHFILVKKMLKRCIVAA